jgi:hypothetical protein
MSVIYVGWNSGHPSDTAAQSCMIAPAVKPEKQQQTMPLTALVGCGLAILLTGLISMYRGQDVPPWKSLFDLRAMIQSEVSTCSNAILSTPNAHGRGMPQALLPTGCRLGG